MVSPCEVWSHRSPGSWSPSQPCPPTAQAQWPTSAHTRTHVHTRSVEDACLPSVWFLKTSVLNQLTCPIPTHIEEGNLKQQSWAPLVSVNVTHLVLSSGRLNITVLLHANVKWSPSVSRHKLSRLAPKLPLASGLLGVRLCYPASTTSSSYVS